MSFGFLSSLIASTGQLINPTNFSETFMNTWGWLGNIWGVLWNGICGILYVPVKWLLAFLDFLQYFIQKLIGLDYWLNNTTYSLSGATDSDLLFSFLYNDTVQRVFTAMVVLFFVLLIIFTIYAIIRSEWQYVTGEQFGSGQNSKASILRNALKAIALVLIFPLMLSFGILSSNAILASLVKALNIDMSSTFGGSLFLIGSRNANKYRAYAKKDEREAITDVVNFYVNTSSHKVVQFGSTSYENSKVIQYSDYEQFLAAIQNCTMYSVNTMFDQIEIDNAKSFKGYCARMDVDDTSYYYLFACGDGYTNESAEAVYYYLSCILQLDVMYRGYDAGNSSIYNEIGKSNFSTNSSTKGYISGVNISSSSEEELWYACWNTWGYASIYEQTVSFDSGLAYTTISNSNALLSSSSGFNLTSFSTLKMLYNSNTVSQYFDGGQFGLVQLRNEYYVMAEVVDFMNNNDITLYMMDITSSMIDWTYSGYQVDTKWVGTDTDTNNNNLGIKYVDIDGDGIEEMGFIVSYSDELSDLESGNILYTAKAGLQDELAGSKFIMCYKVVENGTTKYVPLINGTAFTDPITGNKYTFTSDYYASGYHGVVVAKGVFSNYGLIGSANVGNADAIYGSPTYIKASSDTGTISEDDAYYYYMVQTGATNSAAFVLDSDELTENKLTKNATVTLKSLTLNASYSGYTVSLDSSKSGYRVYNNNGNEQTLSDSFMQSLVIGCTYGSETVTAEYAGQYSSYTYYDGGTEKATCTTYLYKATIGGHTYYTVLHNVENDYFVFSSDSTYEYSESYSSSSTAWYKKAWNFIKYMFTGNPISQTIDTDQKIYFFTEFYKIGVTTATDLLDASDTNTTYVTLDASSLEYSSTSNGYYLFTTAEKQDVNGTYQYLSAYFNMSNLVYLNGSEVDFATPVEAVNSSTEYTFYLYNFYTWYNSAGGGTPSYDGNLYQYHYSDGSIVLSDTATYEYSAGTSTALRYSDTSNGTTTNYSYTDFALDESFTIWVDSDLSWASDSSSLGLYSGKNYIATIYKALGTSVSDITTDTLEVLYNYNTYYNIKSQNAYSVEVSAAAINGADVFSGTNYANEYYESIADSLTINFYRSNTDSEFLKLDFKILWLLNFRAHLSIGAYSMNRGTSTQTYGKDISGGSSVYAGYKDSFSFNIADGISFDYFFDSGSVSLSTFYIQSKLSFWIMLIAAALMIKTLMTAIWGVIKRFYEITLYFLAMPAVASTIPLDNGNRFNSSIQQPLIKKVLSTYGVMLGLNVFFILLTPIQSLSQIFTAEDIATSGTYFLTYLSKLTSYSATATLLNEYVYILFVLVAFTMIDTLPGVISGLIGADDIKASGDQTKNQVKDSLSSAGNIISGKAAMDTVGGAVKGAANFIPGKELIAKPINAIKGGVDHAIEGIGKGIGESYAGRNGLNTPDSTEKKEGEGDGGSKREGGNDGSPKTDKQGRPIDEDGDLIDENGEKILENGKPVHGDVDTSGSGNGSGGDGNGSGGNGNGDGSGSGTTPQNSNSSNPTNNPTELLNKAIEGLEKRVTDLESSQVKKGDKGDQGEEGEQGEGGEDANNAEVDNEGEEEKQGENDKQTNVEATDENPEQSSNASTTENQQTNVETTDNGDIQDDTTSTGGEETQEEQPEGSGQQTSDADESEDENFDADEAGEGTKGGFKEKAKGVFAGVMTKTGGRLKTGVFDLGQRFKKLGGSMLEMVGLKDAFSLRDKNGNKRSMLGFIAGMPLRAAAGVIKAIPNLPHNALNVVKDVGHLAAGLDVMHLAVGYSAGTKQKYGEEGTKTGLAIGAGLIGTGAKYATSKIAQTKFGEGVGKMVDGVKFVGKTVGNFKDVAGSVKDLLLTPAEGFGKEGKKRLSKVKKAWTDFKTDTNKDAKDINEKWALQRKDRRRNEINKEIGKNKKQSQQARRSIDEAKTFLGSDENKGKVSEQVQQAIKGGNETEINKAVNDRKVELEKKIAAGQILTSDEQSEYDNLVKYQDNTQKRAYHIERNKQLKKMAAANENSETDIGKIHLRSGKQDYLRAMGNRDIQKGTNNLKAALEESGQTIDENTTPEELKTMAQTVLADTNVSKDISDKIKKAQQQIATGESELVLADDKKSIKGMNANTRTSKRDQNLTEKRARAIVERDKAQQTKENEETQAKHFNEEADKKESELVEKMQGYFVVDENGNNIQVGSGNDEKNREYARQAASAEIFRINQLVADGTATEDDINKRTELEKIVAAVDGSRREAEIHKSKADKANQVVDKQNEIITDTDAELNENRERQAKRMRKTAIFGGENGISAQDHAKQIISQIGDISEADRIKAKDDAIDASNNAAKRLRTLFSDKTKISDEQLDAMGLKRNENNEVVDVNGSEVTDEVLIDLSRNTIQGMKDTYKAGGDIGAGGKEAIDALADYDANKKIEKKIGTTRRDRYQAANDQKQDAENQRRKIAEGLSHDFVMGDKYKFGENQSVTTEELRKRINDELGSVGVSDKRKKQLNDALKAIDETVKQDEKADKAKAKVDKESNDEFKNQQRIRKFEGKSYIGGKFANQTQEVNETDVENMETNRKAIIKSLRKAGLSAEEKGVLTHNEDWADDKDGNVIKKATAKQRELYAKQQRGEGLTQGEQKLFDALNDEVLGVRAYQLSAARQKVANKVVKKQSKKYKGQVDSSKTEDWGSLTDGEKQKRIVEQEKNKNAAIDGLRKLNIEGKDYNEIVKNAKNERNRLYEDYQKYGKIEDFNRAKQLDAQIKKYNDSEATAKNIRKHFADEVNAEGSVDRQIEEHWTESKSVGERSAALSEQQNNAHIAAMAAAEILGKDNKKVKEFNQKTEEINSANTRIQNLRNEYNGMDEQRLIAHLRSKANDGNLSEKERDNYKGILEGLLKDIEISNSRAKVDQNLIDEAIRQREKIKNDFVKGKASADGEEFKQAQKLNEQIQTYSNATTTADYMQEDIKELDKRDLLKHQSVEKLKNTFVNDKIEQEEKEKGVKYTTEERQHREREIREELFTGKSDEEIVQNAYSNLADENVSEKTKADLREYIGRYISGTKVIVTKSDGQYAKQIKTVNKTVGQYEAKIKEAQTQIVDIDKDSANQEDIRRDSAEKLESLVGLTGKNASADQIINLALQKQSQLQRKFDRTDLEDKQLQLISSYLDSYKQSRQTIQDNNNKKINLNHDIDGYRKGIKEISVGVTSDEVSARRVKTDIARDIAHSKGQTFGIKEKAGVIATKATNMASKVVETVGDITDTVMATETAKRLKDTYGDFTTRPLTEEEKQKRVELLNELSKGNNIEKFSQLGITSSEVIDARNEAKSESGIGLTRVFTYKGHKNDVNTVQGMRRDISSWTEQQSKILEQLKLARERREASSYKETYDKQIKELENLQLDVQKKIDNKKSDMLNLLKQMSKKQLEIIQGAPGKTGATGKTGAPGQPGQPAPGQTQAQQPAATQQGTQTTQPKTQGQPDNQRKAPATKQNETDDLTIALALAALQGIKLTEKQINDIVAGRPVPISSLSPDQFKKLLMGAMQDPAIRKAAEDLAYKEKGIDPKLGTPDQIGGEKELKKYVERVLKEKGYIKNTSFLSTKELDSRIGQLNAEFGRNGQSLVFKSYQQYENLLRKLEESKKENNSLYQELIKRTLESNAIATNAQKTANTAKRLALYNNSRRKRQAN